MLRSDFVWETDEVHDEVWQRIRAVLMELWDPIGIAGIPEAANEYDFYIPQIRKLLVGRASVPEFIDCLDGIATERMGFTSQPENSRAAAEALVHLKTQSLAPELY